jgi:hypothetical protein
MLTKVADNGTSTCQFLVQHGVARGILQGAINTCVSAAPALVAIVHRPSSQCPTSSTTAIGLSLPPSFGPPMRLLSRSSRVSGSGSTVPHFAKQAAGDGKN